MYKSYSQLGTVTDPNVDQYNVLRLKDANHKQEILTNNPLVCVDIYAEWCGPCKRGASDYAMLAREYSDKKVMLVKEDYNDRLTTGVTSVPTFKIYYQGREVDELKGQYIEKLREKLDAVIEKYLQSSQFSSDLPDLSNVPYARNSIRSNASMYQRQNAGNSVNAQPHNRFNNSYKQG